MSLHITQLIIHDFKRLRAVAIDPKSGVPVILTGTNGAGKSSILDSLEWALTRKGVDQPVRRGSKKAIVELTIQNENRTFSLKRTETTKGSHSLVLLAEDGKPVPAPQKFLDGLISSSLAFDPLAFLRLKPKERVASMRVALGLDFSSLDAKAKTAYDERTLVNRDGKNLAERFSVLAEPAPALPKEEVSASDLMAKRDDAVSRRRHVEEIEGDAQYSVNIIARLERELKAVQVRLDAEKAGLESKKQALTAAKENAPKEGEVEKWEALIAAADSTNAAIRAGREYARLKAELEVKRAESQKLTRAIEAIESEKRRRIEEAKFPVNDMQILEEDVHVGDIPFTQLSSGDQITISAEVAMASNAELPIVLIREGALVSQKNLEILFDRVNKRGFALFMEKFAEEPGATGLHIEDGTVAFEDGKPVEREVPPPDDAGEEEETVPAPVATVAGKKAGKSAAMDEALNLTGE